MRAMVLSFLAAVACTASDAPRAFGPSYDGIEAESLDDTLINIRATVSGDATADDAIQYAECAVAQFALFNGSSFARQLRTTVETVDGALVADTAYSISEDVPAGVRKMDAEVVMAACRDAGIPTV